MRVFVAGASGAIGRSLIPQLIAAGHDVTRTTRSEQRADLLRAAGARASVCDALDADALRDAAVDGARGTQPRDQGAALCSHTAARLSTQCDGRSVVTVSSPPAGHTRKGRRSPHAHRVL